MKPTVTLQPGEHRAQRVVFLLFPKNNALMAAIREITGVRWSASKRQWYILSEQFVLNEVFEAFKKFAFVDYSALKNRRSVSISPATDPLKPSKNQKKPKLTHLGEEAIARIEDFRKWMQHKRYSGSTIKSYTEALRGFLSFVGPKALTIVGNEDMVGYVNEKVIAHGLSYSFQNQVVNATKLFFKEIVKSRIIVEKLERPRREHKLPNVLSKEEVKAVLEASSNLKHRAMLSLIYACGLRRSELLNMKPTDVDSNRGLLVIRNSKGNKDRVVPISVKVIDMLRRYYKMYTPKVWLFEGQASGDRYSEQSIQSVLKNAVVTAKIRKPVTLHWLRHSYATHMLEGGVDLRYIQELLGHKSSKTTEIYTHVTIKSLQKIKSPYDDL